jgi:SAM-dependent methyltransferase
MRSFFLPHHRNAYYSSKAFIESKKYSYLMSRFYSEEDGLMSAELRTKNFYYRHHIKNEILGAWRWLGLLENKEWLCALVFDESKRGLDFGGARGPISSTVDICDRLARDLFGNPTPYRSLDEVEDNSFDYIWSSHTLEHIDEIAPVLDSFRQKLRRDGVVVLHLPSYTCVRWRSTIHRYSDAAGDSSHKHTFCLAEDRNKTEGLDAVTEIDTLAGNHLDLISARMCGDNSIFMILKA